MATIKNVNTILDQFDFFSTPDTRRKTTSHVEKTKETNNRPKDRKPPTSNNQKPVQSTRMTYVEDTPSPKKGKKSRSIVYGDKTTRPVIHATPFQTGALPFVPLRKVGVLFWSKN